MNPSLFGAAPRRRRAAAAVRFALCATFLLIAPAAQSALAQEDPLPVAENVIARYIEATGGAEAYAALNNRVSRGTITFSGGDRTSAATSYRARPALARTIYASDGARTLEHGSAGETAWEISWSTGPRILEGVEKARALREGSFDGLADWTSLYREAACTGTEDVDGRPCHRIVLTPPEGEPETLYFDRETGLLVKTELIERHAGAKIPVTVLISDYRPVGGVLLPHRRAVRFMGRERVLTIDSIEHNVQIDPERFKMPATIRAMLLGGAGELAADEGPAPGSDYRFLTDAEAVECAVLDYAEAVYGLKPALIERSVDPKFTRAGYYRPTPSDEFREVPMTYADLLELVENGDKERKPYTGGQKEVTVFDVLDKTAAARLKAVWGVDFIHLAKIDGRWKIVHILWQNQVESEDK